MRRTAADFAVEATGDPWVYTTGEGRDLVPRPRSHWTYDEQRVVADVDLAWTRVAFSPEGIPDWLPGTLIVAMQIRFSEPDVVATEVTAALAEKREPVLDLPDFDAFWAEARRMPLGVEAQPAQPAQPGNPNATPPVAPIPAVPERRATGLRALLAELDDYYVDATPGSEAEKSAAAADPAGAAAGKSASASG